MCTEYKMRCGRVVNPIHKRLARFVPTDRSVMERRAQLSFVCTGLVYKCRFSHFYK